MSISFVSRLTSVSNSLISRFCVHFPGLLVLCAFPWSSVSNSLVVCVLFPSLLALFLFPWPLFSIIFLVFKFCVYFPGVKFLCLTCSLGSVSISLVCRFYVFPGIQVLCILPMSLSFVYIFLVSMFCVYFRGL